MDDLSGGGGNMDVRWRPSDCVDGLIDWRRVAHLVLLLAVVVEL